MAKEYQYPAETWIDGDPPGNGGIALIADPGTDAERRLVYPPLTAIDIAQKMLFHALDALSRELESLAREAANEATGSIRVDRGPVVKMDS